MLPVEVILRKHPHISVMAKLTDGPTDTVWTEVNSPTPLFVLDVGN